MVCLPYLDVENGGVMLREGGREEGREGGRVVASCVVGGVEGGREGGREGEVFEDEVPAEQAIFLDCLDAVEGGNEGTEGFPNCGCVAPFVLPPSLLLVLLLEEALVEC